MQKKLIIIIALIMVALLSVAGCTVNPTPSQNPSPSSQPQASATTPVVTPEVSATPAPSSEAALTSKLKAYSNRLVEDGYSVTKQFHNTTLNGKTAYVGEYQKNGRLYKEDAYPMDSYAVAVNFKEQLINKYKELGYSRYVSSSTDGDKWYGTLGNTLVTIKAYKASENILDTPVVWVVSSPVIT
jgi:PBP1b-binding outer membrane lipoprotein LpoB